MDKSQERFLSMAGVVHVLRNYLDRYDIPDREYLSVNICKRCINDIIDASPTPVYTINTPSVGYNTPFTTFMGMTVNREIPPIHCIICRGKNG